MSTTFEHDWNKVGHYPDGDEKHICVTCGAGAFRAVHRLDEPIGKGYGPIHTNHGPCVEHQRARD